jgi:iron complex transport system substrate-binding protein
LLPAPCSFGDENKENNYRPTRIIVDQMGRKVEVPRHVKRIVIFALPLPLVIYAVDGSGERIAGMNPRTRKCLETNMLGVMAPGLKKSSSSFVAGNTMFNVNIEELIKIKPDVVLQWARMDKDVILMEKMGIPVITLAVRNYEDVTGWIKIAGQLLNKPEKAAALLEYHERTVKWISERTKVLSEKSRPRVFILMGYSGGNMTTWGNHPFFNFTMDLTGAVNVARDLPRAAGRTVNMEQVLDWNPDIIYLGHVNDLTPKDFYENRLPHDWSRIDAVKNRRVYKIPEAGFWWHPPSLESPLYFQWLAQIHHPDLFNDYSMAQVLREFYAGFYRHDLGPDKAAQILGSHQRKP